MPVPDGSTGREAAIELISNTAIARSSADGVE
jgi:hypothetical protein